MESRLNSLKSYEQDVDDSKCLNICTSSSEVNENSSSPKRRGARSALAQENNSNTREKSANTQESKGEMAKTNIEAQPTETQNRSEKSFKSNESTTASVRSSKRESKTPSKFADFTSHKSLKLSNKPKLIERSDIIPIESNFIEESTSIISSVENHSSSVKERYIHSSNSTVSKDETIIKKSPIESIVNADQRQTSSVINQISPKCEPIKDLATNKISTMIRSPNLRTTPEGRRLSSDSSQRYKCEECEKNFKKKSHLDEHMLIHAGEKPFKCEKCGWSFRRKDEMKKHMETCNYVNRESEFSAFLRPCKRGSSSGVTKVVQGILTANPGSSRWQSGLYVCDVCQKDCGYKQNLLFHMKRHEKYGETNDSNKNSTAATSDGVVMKWGQRQTKKINS